ADKLGIRVRNDHFLISSPECEVEVPERLTVSYEALVRSGLADHCVSIPVREATEEEILLIHSEEYLEKVKKTPHMSVQELKDFALQFNAVYFHPNSYHCAKLAVGAALQLVDHVLMGKVRNGMALVRPPGHHSMRDAACGFCTFNNVAIAAQYAKQKYGLKRVLIVDWDIHHGQGVQYCFEDDPSVLYFSWHRYEHSIFWPHLPESDYDAVGKDKGVGFNINVPWNKVGMTNSDFLSVFCHVLLPVAYEGGYNLTSLSQSVCQTVQTLLGDPNPRPENLRSPCQSALESIHCVRWAHRRYWSCLGHAADLSSFQISTKPSGSPKEAGESTWKDKVAVVWPEPVKRVAPPVRTAALLSDEAVCPEGCKRLATSDKLDPRVAGKLRCGAVTSAEERIYPHSHEIQANVFSPRRSGRTSSKARVTAKLSLPSLVSLPSQRKWRRMR
uniref:Histone deacetylase domain-containing protein n=1 Tax=Salarias fasciatus TaxID=181472 RepID=A0A672HGW3_SALFA